MLYSDIVKRICCELSDKNIISFLTTSKDMYDIIHEISFKSIYDYNKIMNVINKHKFENIYLLTLGNENMPNCITHLEFNHYFNQQIKYCIPSNVTHLTFRSCLNQPIKDCIPSTVKKLIVNGKTLISNEL